MTCTCVADCLCDVVIAQATPIADINFATDSLYARRIIEHLDLSAPWTASTLLEFFEFQTRIKERIALLEETNQPAATFKDGRLNPTVAKAKVTTDMRVFIAMRISEGATNRTIREELASIYSVDVSPQYMAMLRKRVRKA
jgi:hypothetical protein